MCVFVRWRATDVLSAYSRNHNLSNCSLHRLGSVTPGMCHHIFRLWRIKKGKVNLLKWDCNIFSGKLLEPCLGTSGPSLWPYQPICILLFDSLLSLMTEQLTNDQLVQHNDLVFGKYYFICLRQKQWISLKTGCCSHYIALLYFVKVLPTNWWLTLLHLLANAEFYSHLAIGKC